MTTTEDSGATTAVHTWWIFLLQGIAALLVGVLLISNTRPTLAALLALLGLYWIIAGVFNIVAVLSSHVAEHKGWLVTAAAVSIIAGLLVLDNMFWSAVVVPALAAIIIGMAALLNGVVTIFAGRREGEHRDRSWAGSFLGILYILFGLLLLAQPLLGALALVYAAAIWGIAGGMVLIVLAFRVRKLAP